MPALHLINLKAKSRSELLHAISGIWETYTLEV